MPANVADSPLVIVSHHDKMEWSRMAQDAYHSDRNDVAHRYSAYASMRSDTRLRNDVYQTLMRNYRLWLVGGWRAFDSGELEG